MAVVTTAFSVALGNMRMQTIPYVGGGSMEKVNTPIPRAEINFEINNGAVTLSGVGDSQTIDITCVLPLSFAYVVQEISLTNLVGVDGDAWEPIGICRIRNNSIELPTWKHSMDLFSRGHYFVSATTRGRGYHLASPGELNRMIIPGTSANLVIQLSNITLNQSAMTIDGFLARFLVFDVNQAYFYGGNTPIPVR